MQAHQKIWKKYLSLYGEKSLPEAPQQCQVLWQNVLVIPAYKESPTLIHQLKSLSERHRRLLVILVLNRPETESNTLINQPLRDAVFTLPPSDFCENLRSLSKTNHLLLIDHDRQSGATPSSQGVGAARKLGCDTALQWIHHGSIDSDWICCTDADAQLPDDYFSRLPCANNFSAAVYPYAHKTLPKHHPDYRISQATQIYEQRLHQYVNGLKSAGSPYAYHTLGSTMAVNADCYAKARGFPKRAGAEDFYLLNKLAKIKPVASLDGAPILLTPRDSDRVPFGTGPAVKAILDSDTMDNTSAFYHPRTFVYLKIVLECAGDLFDSRNAVDAVFAEKEHGEAIIALLRESGIEKAITHCRKQSADQTTFLRHFHQWFDGFQSLKFIRRACRDLDASLNDNLI